MEYEELRREWSNGTVRTMAEISLGKVCYNCGSDKDVELHHIVPLKLGGTNCISNIAVLCHKCHMAAHYGRHIRDYQNKKVSGRPHKADNDIIEKAFADYASGKIGAKECKATLNMSQKVHLTDMRIFKEFKKTHKIRSVKNNIDIIIAKRGEKPRSGEIIGSIVYENGKEKCLICTE